MRIAQSMSMSGVDTDQDLDSSVYDSDNPLHLHPVHQATSQEGLHGDGGQRSDHEGGRGSPTFMDKVNALFRLVDRWCIMER